MRSLNTSEIFSVFGGQSYVHSGNLPQGQKTHAYNPVSGVEGGHEISQQDVAAAGVIVSAIPHPVTRGIGMAMTLGAIYG